MGEKKFGTAPQVHSSPSIKNLLSKKELTWITFDKEYFE